MNNVLVLSFNQDYEVTLPDVLNGKIGEGASSVVYKHIIWGRPAAVKLLKQQFLKRKMIKLFEKMKEIKNPNVIQMLGFCPRPSALVFEYCYVELEDGDIATNLGQVLEVLNDEKTFDFNQRLNFIQQTTDGLNYLHSHGIIHKDLKPTNLLVSGFFPDIIIKVADFDEIYTLKTSMTTQSTIQNLGQKGVTLSYAAVELLTTNPLPPTKASDVFSWSLTAYEILSSHPSPWINILPIVSDALLITMRKLLILTRGLILFNKQLMV